MSALGGSQVVLPTLRGPGQQLPRCPCLAHRGAGSRRAGPRGGAHSPVHPIHVSDPDHLEEGEDDEVQGRGVAVKYLQPVVPRL